VKPSGWDLYKVTRVLLLHTKRKYSFYTCKSRVVPKRIKCPNQYV
jgi:hypothetical protein